MKSKELFEYLFIKAVDHYYDTINAYKGNARDIKKADKHMDGFNVLFKNALDKKEVVIKEKHKAIIPGAFLNKRWDLACNNSAMELKSIVLSKMGKCFSNRVEEAIGVAADLRYGTKGMNLNYFLVVEDDGDTNISSAYNEYTEYVKYQRKVDKLIGFCEYIEKDLKLYDNVACVLLNNDKSYTFLYSDLHTFLDNWGRGISKKRWQFWK